VTQIVKLLLVIAAACGAFVLPASASHGAGDDRVIAPTQIGGLPVFSPFAAALRHFGRSGARTHFDNAGCTITYPGLGLRMSYLNDAPPPSKVATPATCMHIGGAAVGGRGWHTPQGLTVGDSVARLRRIYPHAYDTRHRGPRWDTSQGSTEWVITITCCGGGERPALAAEVPNGHIVALLIIIVGH
jgi:hypothetical protein